LRFRHWNFPDPLFVLVLRASGIVVKKGDAIWTSGEVIIGFNQNRQRIEKLFLSK